MSGTRPGPDMPSLQMTLRELANKIRYKRALVDSRREGGSVIRKYRKLKRFPRLGRYASRGLIALLALTGIASLIVIVMELLGRIAKLFNP